MFRSAASKVMWVGRATVFQRLIVDDGHAGCGEATGSRVSFDAGWNCHRRPSSYLGHAAGRGAPPERLE